MKAGMIDAGDNIGSTDDQKNDIAHRDDSYIVDRPEKNERGKLTQALKVQTREASAKEVESQAPSHDNAVLRAGAIRKSHSTVSNYRANGSTIGEFDDNQRPLTAVTNDHTPKQNFRSKGRNLKDVTTKVVAHRVVPSVEDFPIFADVDGWGDFDSDRLLLGDSPYPDLDDDPLRDERQDRSEQQRARSRKGHHTAPALCSSASLCSTYDDTRSIRSNRPISGKDRQRPSTMQTLRQRPHVKVNFATSTVSDTRFSRNDSISLPTRALPTQTLSVTADETPLPTEPQETNVPKTHPSVRFDMSLEHPMFGANIADTFEMRGLVFDRLHSLWSLMASRLVHSSSSMEICASSLSLLGCDTQTKSPFECRMALMKLCKAAGIALGASSSLTSQLEWPLKDKEVDFSSFCRYVIQNIIQPTLHNYKLDTTSEEYVKAIDKIVQSLIVDADPVSSSNNNHDSIENRRLRDLSEIQPVFSFWKSGIGKSSKQLPIDRSSKEKKEVKLIAQDSKLNVQQLKSASLQKSYNPNPVQFASNEAKIIQDESIRRKVQLHKSWQSRTALMGTSTPNEQLEVISASLIGTKQLVMADEHQINLHGAVNEKKLTVDTTPNINCVENDEEHNQVILVCGSCSTNEAILWCSSCFTVYCQSCWQGVHSSNVDLSCIQNMSDNTAALLAPATRPIKSSHVDDPPFAMVYLPAKPMMIGKIFKGVQISKHNGVSADRNNTLQHSESELINVRSHSILPPIQKAKLEGTFFPESPSITELLKSSMLGVASIPTNGSFSSSSVSALPFTSLNRHYHDPANRKKLQASPVTLDATQLLSEDCLRAR